MASDVVLAKLEKALPTLLDHATRAHAIAAKVQGRVDERCGGIEAQFNKQSVDVNERLRRIEEVMRTLGATLHIPEETFPSPRSSTPLASGSEAVGLPWSPRAVQTAQTPPPAPPAPLQCSSHDATASWMV